MKINDDALGRVGRILVRDNAADGLVVDNRYEVHHRIARGGMGEIFYARDIRLNRPVAMKILAPELSSPKLASRFQAEAKTLTKLEHPGVVPIFDFGTMPDGRLYYTMKFVSGKTLEELIDRGEKRDRLLKAIIGICEVVQHGHERGIIHRDLKPANFMVDEGGHVFVLDWGIAKAANELQQASGFFTTLRKGFTSPGVVMGTLQYMAPEQARGEVAAINALSDVYALGATLYHVLTGRPPVDAETADELMARAAAGSRIEPRKLNPSIPPDLEAVCLKAMRRHPAGRYASAKAMAQDLDRFLKGIPVNARPASTVRQTVFFMRHRPFLSLAAGVFLVAALVVGILITRSVRMSQAFAEQERVAREAQDLLDRGRGALDDAQIYLYDPGAEYRELLSRLDRGQPLLQRSLDLQETPRAHLLLAQAWELRAHHDKAEHHLRRAIEMEPGSGLAHYHLARLLLRKAILARLLPPDDGEPGGPAPGEREAKESMDLLAKAKGGGMEDDLRREVAQAMVHYARGEDAELAETLRTALARFRGRRGTEELHFLSAGLETTAARQRPHLDRALEIRPKFAEALYCRGVLLQKLKETDRALADYEMALTINPRFWQALSNRGMIHHAQGRAEKALEDFSRTLELAPASAAVLANRGAAHFELGHDEAALRDFDDALRIRPSFTTAYYNRALVHRRRGDRKAEIDDLGRAIDLRRDFYTAWADRGTARLLSGDHAGAAADLRRALELAPANWKHRRNAEKNLQTAEEGR